MPIYKQKKNNLPGAGYYEAILSPEENDLYGSSRIGTLNLPPDPATQQHDYFLPGQFDAVSFDNDPLKRTTEFSYLIQASEKEERYNSASGAPDEYYLNAARINKVLPATQSFAPLTDFFAGSTGNNISQYVEGTNALFALTVPEYWGKKNVTLIFNNQYHLIENCDALNNFEYDPDAKGVFVQDPVNPSKYYYFNRQINGGFYASTIDLSLQGLSASAATPWGSVLLNDANKHISAGGTIGRHFAVAGDKNKKITYVYFTVNDNGTTTINRVRIDAAGPDVAHPERVGEYAGYDDLGNGEMQFSPDGKWLSVYNGLGQQGWFDAREAEILSIKVGGDFLPAGRRETDAGGLPVETVENVSQPVANGNVGKGSLDFGKKGQHVFYNQHTLAMISNSSGTPANFFACQKLLTSTSSPFIINDEERIDDLRRTLDYTVSTSTHNMFSTNNLPASAFYSWNYMGYYTNTRATGLALAVTDEHSAGYLPVQPYLIDNAVLVNETHNRLVGDKSYELADHLGDVRAIVSDRKTGYTFFTWPVSTTSLNNLTAEISGVNNYYAGGMLQPGRNYNAPDYRFSYNGKEHDDEIKGTGNSLDFGARMYDPRLIRFMSIDPLFKKYAWQSSYAYVRNNPIFFMDINGEGDPLATMKIRGNRASNLQGKVRTPIDGDNAGVANSQNHQGFDLYAKSGTPTMAVKDAVVFKVVHDEKQDYGKQITLKITDAEGTVRYAQYSHLSCMDVKEGDKVKEGQVIGETGTTGNAKGMTGENQHLHFEYRDQPSPGTGLGGRLSPNEVLDTKFYSQDPKANQATTGVIKEELDGTTTKMNTNGSQKTIVGPTPVGVDSDLQGAPRR